MNRGRIVITGAALTALLVTGLASGGIGGTGVRTNGPVAKKGSVVVNGVKYETDNSLIWINGLAGTDADLKVGQLLDIDGSVDAGGSTGIALSISVEDTIRGPVTAVDEDANTITIAGQTIDAGRVTVFDRSMSDELEDIRVGDFLTVFAQFDHQAAPRSTRLEPADPAEGIRITGDVDASLTGNRVMINALAVDLSGAVISGGTASSIGPGVRARVDGLAFGAAGELLATRVTVLERQITDTSRPTVSVEGYINDFASILDFAVDGQRVAADFNTVFDAPLFGLGVSDAVIVKGVPRSDGSILATSVASVDSADQTVLGTITNIHDDAIEIDYSIVIEFDDYARFQDRTASKALPFGTRDLRIDDLVEIQVNEDGYTGVMLTRTTRGGMSLGELLGQIWAWFGDGEDD